MVIKIFDLLSKYRLPLQNEKLLQAAIEDIFKDNGIIYEREYYLDGKNVIDFLVEGCGIEIKIKGNVKQIYKQCERYCGFSVIESLILVSNRSCGFPPQILGKDCYFLNLGRSWL